MSKRFKTIFLSITIVIPFLIYCIIYYKPIFENAPFRANELVSVQIEWGTGQNLMNRYNSETGVYQYLNPADSVITIQVKLRKDDMLFIHGKASELGFWNFPELIANPGEDITKTPAPRYVITMKYKRKSKSVTYVSDYHDIPKLKNVAEQMQKMVISTINTAEDRYGAN